MPETIGLLTSFLNSTAPNPPANAPSFPTTPSAPPSIPSLPSAPSTPKAHGSSAIDDVIGVRVDISDSAIVSGLRLSGIVCCCALVAFCILQRTSLLYRYRLAAKGVTVKPPQLAQSGLMSLFDWAIKALTVSDVEFVRSAGLDALIMVKLCALGVQMFLPMCIFSVAILIPLHLAGGEAVKDDIYRDALTRVTIANCPPRAKVFWVHFCFVYVYMGWAMLLLRWHFQQYLMMRQHYLRKGDEVNLWRTLYDEHPGQNRVSGLRGYLQAVPLIKALLPTGVPEEATTQPDVEAGKESDSEYGHRVSNARGRRGSTATNGLSSGARGSGFAGEVRRRHAPSAGRGSLLVCNSTAEAGLPMNGACVDPTSVDPAVHVAGTSEEGRLPSANGGARDWRECRALEGREDLPKPGDSGKSPGASFHKPQGAPVAEGTEGDGGGDPAAASGASGAPLNPLAAVTGQPGNAVPDLKFNPAGERGELWGEAEVGLVMEPAGPGSPRGAGGGGDRMVGFGAAGAPPGVEEGGVGMFVHRAVDQLHPAPDSLDPDASSVMWWADFGRLRHCGWDGPGCVSSGRRLGAVPLSLSRPSVSQRKTVNALANDGTRVAVMAQHYAVLVTNVEEPKPDEDAPGVQAKANVMEASVHRVASFVPSSLRRWFSLGYGKQAARELNLRSLPVAAKGWDDSAVVQSPHLRPLALRTARSAIVGRVTGTALADVQDATGQPTAQAVPNGRSSGDTPCALTGRRAATGTPGMWDRMQPDRPRFLHVLDLQVERALEVKEAAVAARGGASPALPTARASAKRSDSPFAQQEQPRLRGHVPLASAAARDYKAGGDSDGSCRPGIQDTLGHLRARWQGEALDSAPSAPAQLQSAHACAGPGTEADETPGVERRGAGSGESPAIGDSLEPACPSGDPAGCGPCPRDETGVLHVEAAPAAAKGNVDDAGKPASLTTAAARASKWDLVREAVRDGRVARLPTRKRYSIVSATFSRLFPDEFDRAVPVINHKEVDLLLMRAERALGQYEHAKRYEELTGKPLYGRIGFWPWGERRRLREHYLQEVNTLMAQVRAARRRAFDEGHTPSWFVFFRTQRAAAIASQCVIQAEDHRLFRVYAAPGPEEVNWSALWCDYASRDLRRNLLRPLIFLMVLFPIGIFSGGLMQLDYLLCSNKVCANLEMNSAAWNAAHCVENEALHESQQMAWHFYCEQKNFIAKLMRHVVINWLPSLLVVLWQGLVLTLSFTFIVQKSCSARSLSDADRLIAKYMFYFAVFNVFLGGLVGGTITQGINSAIEKGPAALLDLVGSYVPSASNFFINYTTFRALVSVPMRMVQPHVGIRMYLVRRFFRASRVITKRDKAFLLAPVSPRYGFEVGMVLLIFVIAFAFSLVSPLILPLAVLYFMMAWLFWRWALLYVYVRKYEGGGTMWPLIYYCVLACMGIFGLFTACVFIAKRAYVQAIILLFSIPVILIRFNRYMRNRFQNGINAMPLEATMRAPIAHIEPWVYMPPPLLPNLAGWNPDWPKCWQGWNFPVMYG